MAASHAALIELADMAMGVLRRGNELYVEARTFVR